MAPSEKMRLLKVKRAETVSIKMSEDDHRSDSFYQEFHNYAKSETWDAQDVFI